MAGLGSRMPRALKCKQLRLKTGDNQQLTFQPTEAKSSEQPKQPQAITTHM